MLSFLFFAGNLILQNLYTWMWGFGENNVTIQLCTKQQWPFPKTNILCMSLDVKINCLDVNPKPNQPTLQTLLQDCKTSI
jgi:hypothetical protein